MTPLQDNNTEAPRARAQGVLPHPAWIGLIGALALAGIAYAPGLRGVYVFDDFPNIVDNVHLHVTSLDWRAWAEAIWSSPSTDLHRPLSTLTFALNYFFGRLAPAPMKAVNLAIHLVNGVLLFVLLRSALTLRADGAPAPMRPPGERVQRPEMLALLVAAAWVLHPINLTAVLYVVQRMESLAQIFVLCGLLFYVGARRRQLAGNRAGWRLWLGVPAATLIGITAKESAALVPLYALVLELTLLRGEPRSRLVRRELQWFFAVFLMLPLCLGLVWLLPRILSPGAWAARTFTLWERLLSEPRALMDYVGWTVLPLPDSFSLYRDDFPPSRGLTQPWTTILSIGGVTLMLAAAWASRNRRPLVTLGLAWFLAAHALTATILPLELMFEHRNYFASVGLLLAAIDIALPAPVSAFPVVRRAMLGVFLVLCASTTFLRAVEWGDPVRFAVAENAKHPASPRASYELARVLVVLTGYRADSPIVPRALAALKHATEVPGARTQPDAALLAFASRTGTPIEGAWWNTMIAKLKERPPMLSDSDALQFLAECTRQGTCRLDRDEMVQAFTAALSHSPPDPAVLYAYAIYAYNALGDASLALTLAKDAVRYAPEVPQYRVNLVNFLIELGRFDEAGAEIDRLRRRNRFGRLQAQIAGAEEKLAAARAAAGRGSAVPSVTPRTRDEAGNNAIP